MYRNGYPCICSTCANNEERMHKTPGEAVEFCYICDECSVYMGKGIALKVAAPIGTTTLGKIRTAIENL